jgi:hypothetical protein
MERGQGFTYICDNIECCRADVPRGDKYRAKEVIMKRLHPYYSVWEWVYGHNLPNLGSATPQDFREFRIRWLKALEEEFKAKGD